MPVVFECGGAELREAGGDTFSTIVKDGTLAITVEGRRVSIDVSGNTVDWVADAAQGPFKRIDTRSFMFATNDLMTFRYITLPRGLPEQKYEHLNAVLTAIKDGQPIPKTAPLAAALTAPPVAAAPAAGTAAAAGNEDVANAAKPKPDNSFGGLMSAIAQKAAHDTMMLGDMIKQKAAHDMQSMQDTQHKTA